MFFFYLTDSLSEINSDISCTSENVNFTFCMQFTGEVTIIVDVGINIIGLYYTMIGLRQVSEPRPRQQAGKENLRHL